jgi:hypothetical protein
LTLMGLNENLPDLFLDRCTSTGCRPARRHMRMMIYDACIAAAVLSCGIRHCYRCCMSCV